MRWGPSPRKKGGTRPIFGSCLLWLNGWMDQGATWYGARPRPSCDIVLDGNSSPKKEHSRQFSSHIYCGQTAGWIKILLGTKVGLGPGHIALDMGPSCPKRVTAPYCPQFSTHVYCGQTVAHRPSQLLVTLVMVALCNTQLYVSLSPTDMHAQQSLYFPTACLLCTVGFVTTAWLSIALNLKLF